MLHAYELLESEATMKKRTVTLLELLGIIAIVVIFGLLILPAMRIASRPLHNPQNDCCHCLKQFGLTFKMYANESPGLLYPPMQSEVNEKGKFLAMGPMFYSVYPEYLTDPNIVICPGYRDYIETKQKEQQGDAPAPKLRETLNFEAYLPNEPGGIRNVDISYVYFPWVLDQWGDDPAELAPLKQFSPLGEALRDYSIAADEPVPAQLATMLNYVLAEGIEQKNRKALDADIPCPEYGNAVGKAGTIYHLQEGIEKLLTADPEQAKQFMANTVVMMDAIPGEGDPFMHEEQSCNVLFLDGHVEFIAFPEKPPMTKPFRLLESAFRDYADALY